MLILVSDGRNFAGVGSALLAPEAVPRQRKTPPRSRSPRASGRRPSGRNKAGKSARKGKRGDPRAKKASKASKARSKGNRRVAPSQSKGAGKTSKPFDLQEFKSRNRTILLLLVLAFVNGWIFVWRDEGGLDSFEAKAAVIGGGGERGGFAAPLASSCGGDPVSVFENLDDQLRLETKLDQGKTLRLGLLELGLGPAAIDEVEAEIRKTMDLGMLTGSGAPLRVAGDREGGLAALELEVSEGHLIQACRGQAGLEVRNMQHPLRVDVAIIALRLPKNGSLQQAVIDAEQDTDLARMIAHTLAGEIDFNADVRPDDRIQVLVEKRYLGRNFHRYGKLLAIRYTGNAGRMAFYRFKPKGMDEGFFDHEGRPMRRELLRTPFAWHPVDPDARASLAPAIEFVDGRMGAVYRRSLGAPVVAVSSGTVREVGQQGDDGLVLELELGDGRRIRYANLLRTIGDPSAGDVIEQGQVLALVGQTGKTPLPRLRLELVAPSGERLDPMVLGARGRLRAERSGESVPEAQLEQFQSDIQSWRRAMRKAAE